MIYDVCFTILVNSICRSSAQWMNDMTAMARGTPGAFVLIVVWRVMLSGVFSLFHGAKGYYHRTHHMLTLSGVTLYSRSWSLSVEWRFLL